MNYNRYYRVSDSNKVRFESVSKDEALNFLKNVFEKTGELLSMEEIKR